MYAGGGLMSSDDHSTVRVGETITIIGLAVQVVFFGFFIITAIVFHIRINKSPTVMSTETKGHWCGNITARNWVTLLLAMYVVSILILVRSVFRMVEFIDGYGGYIMGHEVFIYIFDAVLMVLVMAILNFWHPSFVIRDGKRSTVRGDFEQVPLQ
jgi:magnesium-transporting ATPase (P-type)